MKKFLIGVVTGMVLAALTGFIVILSLARFGGETGVSVPDEATLFFRLEGEVPERAPVEFPVPFFEQQAPSTVQDVWELLRKAATDKRIKAVVFEPRGVDAGWGKMQEIRSALQKYRESGKPLVAYLRNPGTREYYLASTASKVYLSPEDYLNVKGLLAELMFFRNTLDKLGVEVQIEHAGKYKDFGDMFVRDKMSPETKEVIDSVLDDLYAHLTSTIGQSRGKTPEEMRALLDEGPFLAVQAKSRGLVDDLLYEDQVEDELKKLLKMQEIRKLSHRQYAKVSPESLGLEGGSRIAIVVGEGGITAGESDEMSDGGIASISFIRQLRRVAKDESVRGVIVRIDSPGGDAIASDEIWREMNLLSKKKPLVFSMSDSAASGGYYIAMTGDPIVAYPGTFTGSIGVVFGKANLKGLYAKLGISKDHLKRGQFADIESDYTSLNEAARRKIRDGVDATYQAFVAKVAEARKKKPEEIEPWRKAGFGSVRVKDRGLVDELGGLDKAIEMVRRKARIPDQEKITLVTYPPKRTVFDLLFDRSPEVTLESVARLSGVPWAPAKRLEGWQVRLLTEGGFLRLMPYTLDVR